MTNLRRWASIILLILSTAGAFHLHAYLKERAMHAIPYGFQEFHLADPIPTCGRWKEHMPAKRDPNAYQLYIAARKVWRSKIGWQLTREETSRILTDVRMAADMGDWGARALMAHFYLYGLGVLDSNHVLDADPEKAIEIDFMAAKAGQPWALFDLGVAYEHGYGGLPRDEKLAWAYYLRAARLGSPDAQVALASAYGHANRPEDARAMLKCAYQQGHGAAAYELGIWALSDELYEDAIHIYQEGIKFGSADCASSLWLLFLKGYWSSSSEAEKASLRQLGIRADAGRADHYSDVMHALEINPDLRLGRIDEVLPLPPEPLPEWSGIAAALDPEPEGPPRY